MCVHLEGICSDIVEKLRIWPSLMASLQSGRGEINKAGLIEQALSDRQGGKILLMEHKDVDFAFIDPASITTSHLWMTTLIEFKFNYTNQLDEFARRLRGRQGRANWSPSAFQQVSRYRDRQTTEHRQRQENNRVPGCAYVLYLTASPWDRDLATYHRPRDAGFLHFDSTQDAALKSKNQCANEIDNMTNQLHPTILYLEQSDTYYCSNDNHRGTYLTCHLFKLNTDTAYTDPGRPQQ